MKKIITILTTAMIFSSCATSKIVEVNGKAVTRATWTKKHFDKVHPNGFYAGRKYIVTNKK